MTGPCHIERCWLNAVSDGMRRATSNGYVFLLEQAGIYVNMLFTRHPV